MNPGIDDIEIQLRKWFIYPYEWNRRQNDSLDNMTNFIYQVWSFDDLLTQIDSRFKGKSDYNVVFNYALNRLVQLLVGKSG